MPEETKREVTPSYNMVKRTNTIIVMEETPLTLDAPASADCTAGKPAEAETEAASDSCANATVGAISTAEETPTTDASASVAL